MKIFTNKLTLIIIFAFIANCAFAQSGTVFRDYNGNGTKDTNEPLLSGVLVKAYNSSGALCASATTTATAAPNYTLPTTCSGQVRVEFEIPATNTNLTGPLAGVDFTSSSGAAYGTSVQFVNAGAANVNLAINAPADYCDADPKVITNCYVQGNNTGTEDVVVSFPYSSSGVTPTVTHDAIANEVGTTWGLAYSKTTKQVFASAFLKRHSGLGSGGIGAIYTIDPSGVANPTLWLDVETLSGVDVGSIGTNTARGLGTSTASSVDAAAFAKVGKEGIGDIDISEDGKTLYVMNLFQKTVLEIDIATKTLKNKYTVPDPGCGTNGSFRPFATKFYRGNLYVGVVCSGETSGSVGNFFIMKLTGTSFTSVLSAPLSYPKGWVHATYATPPVECDNFESWTDDFTQIHQAGASTAGPRWCRPQPILSDIEFDIDGSMIIGFMDRTGHQTGYLQPNTANTATGNGYVGGDILRAYNNNGTFVLENAGTTLGGGGAGANGDGPGGGEYYTGERFPATGTTTHEETSHGGLALKPGTGEVLLTAMDPGTVVFAGGIIALSNSTGQKTDFVQLYASSSTTNTTFGKAAGLGDLEILCAPSPIEIGNRVWRDTDQDGIQDANETPIANVTLELFADFNGDGSPDGAALASTTTSATGEWYFNQTNVTDGDPATTGSQAGLLPNAKYLVRVAASDWTSGAGTADLLNLVPTKRDQTSAGIADVSDSDAYIASNIPTIAVTTGVSGENNHTLDMGFFSCTKPTIAFTFTPATCTNGTKNNDGALTVTPTNADRIGISYGGTSYSGPEYDYATSDFSLPLTNALTAPTTVWIRAFSGSNLSTCRKDTSFTLNPTPCVIPDPCNAAAGQIGGTVFRDFNNTGTLDSLEIGLAGIPVKVFDCDGNLLGTTTTDKFGNYSFSGMPSSKVRVEFGTLPAPYVPTKHGADNGTTTQFVTAPDCTVDLGVNDPTDYCQTNPYLTTVCYVVGNPLASGYPTNGGANDALVSTRYDLASAVNHDVKYSDLGSAWGISYNRLTKKLFTSAWVKRHTGLGPLGAGGIYVVDYSAGDPATVPPTKSNFIDLAALGVNVGTIASNSARGLTGASNVATMDSLGWYATGKVGLGDIDISDDFNSLFTVSLATKEVIKVNISNYNSAGIKPTAADVTKLPAFPATCVGGETRPFGLKYYKGKLYVGVVCDGSTSQTLANVKAAVYAYDFTSSSWSTAVAPFSLDYRRGPVHNSGCQYWIPWTDDPLKVVTSQGPSFNGRCFPQPLLSDIEFDVDGSMILGFADRGAHMMGSQQPLIDNPAVLVTGVNGGDILRVYNNNGTYVLENEGTTLGGGGAGYNSQGPGGGEYYSDNFPSHQNTSLGGLALLAGTNEVVYTTIDPTRFESAGYRRTSNTTGQTTKAMELYYTPATGSGGTFNKGAGLGDAELLCELQPIEIGNRLWVDTDKDGVQDPCENPIANVSVSLYDNNGVLIAQTTTDANGNYYFNETNVVDTVGVAKRNVLGPQALTNYFIVAGKEDGSFNKTTSSLTSAGTQYQLTIPNSTQSNGNDQNDSDAQTSGVTAIPTALNGFPTIAVTTPASGSNQTYDFGFSCSPAVLTATVTQATCTGGTANSDAKIEFTSSKGDKYSITQGATSTATYATATAITANAGSLTGIANPTSATQYTIRIFNGGDACFKDTTVTLQPKTCVAPVCSISLTAVPTACNPATNTYSVSGSLTFANVPTTGTLTVSDGTATQVFNAPFTSTQAYTLSGLISDGASHTVTAIFSATPTCTNTITYTAPVSCACPAQDNKICAGESYTLTAQAGLTGYQWYTIVGTDTTAISGAISQSYTATTTGTFIWKAKDASGCDIKLCCPVIITPGTCYGSIGDYVWTDANNDGQQTSGEAPIAGVKVYLLNASGVKIDSTVTNALGKYLFDSLTTGSYKIQFVAPAGTIASKQNTGADATDSDANKAGLSQLINIDTTKLPTDTLRNNPQIDAGFVPVGSIGDYVFNDKDGDGIQDATDTPIAGIKVYLLDAATGAKLDSTLTDATGKYLFDSLLTGDYKVKFVIPAGSDASPKIAGTDTTKDSNINPDGTTDTISINTALPIGDGGRNNTTIDAGIKPAYGSIGDYVWTDTNNDGQQTSGEAPIAGVKVYLLDGTTGAKLDSTVTDALGKYLFDSLLTGSYKVQFVAPIGTIAAKQNTGADVTDSDANKAGLSQLINIDTTKLATDTLRNNPQIDAGFVPVGSIGDYVFEDVDKSNTQTAGDTPLAGVKVYLLNATTGAKLDSTTTDANGLYLFDSLVAGNYKVQFVAPSGTLLVSKVSGTDVTKDSNPDPTTGITDAVTIDTTQPIGSPARDNRDVDAGIKLIPAYGSIGDYVWSDVSNNGQQDGAETSIAGVKVYLYDATGTTKLDSTLTDASGKYLFDSLLTGSYKVKFVAPAGTFPAKQNTGADVSDSDANDLGFSQVINIDATKAETDTLRNNPQIDAGFVPFGSIGDYVFDDKDNSNTQTAGDLPVAGVKVYLLDATTGAKLDSTLTDAAGLYKFDSLVAGNYKVQVVVPTGMLVVTKDSGTDDTKDSDIDPTGTTGTYTVDVTKPIGDPLRDITSVDAGIKGNPQYGSIGDYVWSDVNNNGQQDGTESPIAGVKVYLYDATGTTKLDSTLTDAAGKYLFDSLLTGGYKVKFEAPVGTFPTKQNTGADVTDSDANNVGWSQVVNIDVTKLATDTLRNNPQIDAGFVPFGSIGDYVFEDKDNSNTQTAGDLPIAGVKVYLLDATTGAKLDSTITDGAGKYLFDSLVAGNYKVQFVAPSGSILVTKTSGTDVTKDSNPDPSTGITDAVTIDTTQPLGSPARDNRDVDAGVKAAPQFGSIGDYVWADTNNNGQQDGTEAPIAGVKVYLYDATGTTKLDSTLTDASGKYLFDSLITAGYKVQFVAPAGTIAAKQNTGADISDSDANKAGWSQLINIDASLADTDTLRNNPQIDAGFVPVGSIGDYVFQDKDNSNTQTAGDLPLAGVKVYLLDATTGAKLDSTLTDAAGLYKFDSLVAGNYKVQVTVPTGMTAVTKDSGTDDTKDSDIDPTGTTGTITVDTTKPIGDPLRDITNVDAGLKGNPQYGSIGDYVWFDNNNNGQQDGTESPIQGVKVYLYDAAGTTKLDSTLTDATGKYLFDSLLTGGYKVQFVAPAGTIPAKQNTGADVSDSDANKLGWSQVVNIDVTKLATDTLRNNPQIDAGFVPFGSIGDYVFQDKDNSNTQTVGDTPIPCIVVYLLDATTGAKLDSTMTDISGKYQFDSLLAGNYKIQFVAPLGGTFVTPLSGGDVIKDSNPDATGLTATVTIDPTQPIGSPARDNRDVDAGLKIVGPFGSIGDYVWSDVNNNGQQDSGEAPIAGVKVYLYDATGTMIMDSTVTDATGKYLFDSLFTADYRVKFVAPAGTIASKQNTGADVTDSDANQAGWSQIISIDVTKLATDTLRNNPQIDAGFVPVGSIGDYVFEDKDNSNTQTAGDSPIQGVKVYLLDATTGAKLDSTITDGAGKYLFDSLIAGNYKVQFVAPSGTDLVTKTSGTDVTKDSNADPLTGITDAVTIDTTQPIGSPARDNRDVDAGIKASLAYGSLGDYVWMDTDNDGQQDAAEAPIAGVKVYLYDASGTTKLDSTLTDAAGKYLFDSLLTGAYKVKYVAPAGTVAAKQNTGVDVTDSDANKAGWSQVVNIDVTLAETDTLRNNPQIDAGFVPVGSIGDYVFNDKDNSNTQTTGDLPIAGVTVYLLDATTGAKLDSTITDSNGLYKFDSLVAGNYKVQVVAPTGMTVVTKDSGTDDTKDSDIDPTGTTGIVTVDTTKPIGDPLRDIINVDAGLKGNPAYGSIGNFVWTDQNNNGQQDGTETPIQGVKIYLYDGTGTVLLDSTVTNAAGNYLFDSLLTGSYKVKFVAPVGTIPAKQNTGADVTDSDANKAGWSQVVNIDVTKASTDTLRNNPQIDAGFVPVGSIGDYVFNDKDNSNTQTAGDLPIGGVKVYLLDATTGVKLDSTVTDGAGKYLFDSLVAGSYKVQFVAPVGTNLVTKTSGTDVTKDSNPDPATGITDAVTIDTTKPIGDPARDNRDVDAGLKGQPQYGSIGDYVWMDSDNDGQQDATEAPIAGVKVYLYDAAGLVKIDSALTDASGKYLFDSLLTGGYKVKFVAPAGTIAAKQNTGADVTDSDANKLGWSQVVNIDVTLASTDTLRNNPKIDAGFVPVGSIGDYVFVDNDNSNTQTAGDTPVAGVKVYLLDAVTGAKLDSTVTNINGLYKFDSLLAGNYKVQFVAPTGASLVTKDSGTDDTKDSDADATGTTGIVTVDTTKPVGDPARDITSVDAGLAFKVDLKLTKVAVGDCKRKVGDVVAFKVMVKRQDLIITDVAATVKDSLSANFEFVSATATEGTYNNTTGIWSGISLAQGDSAVLTVNARIRQGVAGLACNDAWIQTIDKGDFDSIAGNKIETEDDFARACVSVPLPICTARGEKAELTAPAGYTNYQWFKNGQLITGATSSTYMATTFGEYTVTVNSGSCPSTGCCPIYVDEFCDCPPTICVPFVIQKTKSRK